MNLIELLEIPLTASSWVTLARASTYPNPIRATDSSNPFIVYTGGYYYLLTTSWTNVEISRATTLEGLKSSTKKVVNPHKQASRCCNVWSPEVHYFNGVWYTYYTAGESADLNGQNLHVLVGMLRTERDSDS
jgi:GH43 family beta-xylosidase